MLPSREFGYHYRAINAMRFTDLIDARCRPVAEDPKLVWNYTGIAIATFIAGNVFYACFYKRDRDEEAENAVGKDHGSEVTLATTGHDNHAS